MSADLLQSIRSLDAQGRELIVQHNDSEENVLLGPLMELNTQLLNKLSEASERIQKLQELTDEHGCTEQKKEEEEEEEPSTQTDEFQQMKATLDKRVESLMADLTEKDQAVTEHEVLLLQRTNRVKELEEESQRQADEAARYRGMYHELLDTLEEQGVEVSMEEVEGDVSQDGELLDADAMQRTPSCSQLNRSEAGSQPRSKSMSKSTSRKPRSTASAGDSDESEEDDGDASEGDEEKQEEDIMEMIHSQEDLAAIQVSQELQSAKSDLPLLEGFLEKKSPTFGRGWQKRYVVVRDYNIFYGREKVSIETSADVLSSKKFLNCVSLLVVKSVHPVDSKKDRKFEIMARDPRTGDMRSYLWRSNSVQERNRWVEGLLRHKDHLHAMLQWVSLNKGVDLQVSSPNDPAQQQLQQQQLQQQS